MHLVGHKQPLSFPYLLATRYSSQMAFTNAQHTNIYGGTLTAVSGDFHYSIGNMSVNMPEPSLLPLFGSTSPGATFDSHERHPHTKCQPGTRSEILDQITQWIDRNADDGDGHGRILWLHGPAGAGKSAVAQSVAEDCAQRNILAASFFFSRSRAGRDSIDRLFTTIAYQLAISIPNLKPIIQSIISNDPSITHRRISVQIQELIIKPLLSLVSSSQKMPHPSNPMPSLIIIDGLDECAGRENQDQVLSYVLALARTPRLPLRFLIVSRPEYNIRHAFEKTELSNFVSEPISIYGDFRSREDVRAYLVREFDRIQSSSTHEPLMARVPKPWPSTPILDLVVQRSDGYFIYASTLVRFVDQEFLSPAKQLDIILNSSTSGSEAFGELDKLYKEVLCAVPNIDTLKMVLGAVFTRVPTKAISELFLLEAGHAFMILRALQAVITVRDEDDIPIPVHASFSDFIFDRQRAGKFHMDRHEICAQSTRAMLDHLRCLSAVSGGDFFINASADSLQVALYIYRNWFDCFTAAGTHQGILAEEIRAMDKSLWFPLPPETEQLAWHDEKFVNLKVLCAGSMMMLLKFKKRILDPLQDSDDLMQYFATLCDRAFGQLIASPYPQAQAIVSVFSVAAIPEFLSRFRDPPLCWIQARSAGAHRDVLMRKLLCLERPLSYRILKIFELLKTLAGSLNDYLGQLRDYLKNAPPELLLDPTSSHAYLAHRCLNLLTADVDEVLEGESTEEYQYARCYWALHVKGAPLSDDKLLLHQLRSMDRRCLFNVEYFSGTISYVEELKCVGVHILPKECCKLCSPGKELAPANHDKTILKLSTFNGTIRQFMMVANVSEVRMIFLEHDVENVEKVLSWLKEHPDPPLDLVQRWETYQQELLAAIVAVNNDRDSGK